MKKAIVGLCSSESPSTAGSRGLSRTDVCSDVVWLSGAPEVLPQLAPSGQDCIRDALISGKCCYGCVREAGECVTALNAWWWEQRP